MSTNTQQNRKHRRKDEPDFPEGARVSLRVYTGLTPEVERISGEIVDTEPPVVRDDAGNEYDIRGRMVELDGELVGWLALGRVLRNRRRNEEVV